MEKYIISEHNRAHAHVAVIKAGITSGVRSCIKELEKAKSFDDLKEIFDTARLMFDALANAEYIAQAATERYEKALDNDLKERSINEAKYAFNRAKNFLESEGVTCE